MPIRSPTAFQARPRSFWLLTVQPRCSRGFTPCSEADVFYLAVITAASVEFFEPTYECEAVSASSDHTNSGTRQSLRKHCEDTRINHLRHIEAHKFGRGLREAEHIAGSKHDILG